MVAPGSFTPGASPPQSLTTLRHLLLERHASGAAKIEAFAGAPHGFGRELAHKDRLIAAAKAYIEPHTAATVAVSRPSQGRPPR